MKVKKIVTTLCAITGVLCLAIAPTRLNVFANADSVGGEDILFTRDNMYRMESALEQSPKTIEVNLQLDKSHSTKGGVIFSDLGAGAYINTSNRTMGTDAKNVLSLEIDTKGRPKLYHKDDIGTVNVVVFKTDIRANEFVNLAVTMGDGVANCYVNGELKDSQAFAVEETVSVYPFSIGGDQTEKRGNCFNGKIRSLAVYADERSETEIQADITSIDLTDNQLLACYDLQGQSGSDIVQDKSVNDNDLIHKWLFVDEMEIDDYDYSMMVLGDTQSLNHFREDLSPIYDYIVANAEEQKVVHVAQLGDLCQYANADEFGRVKTEFLKLDQAGIRYSVLAGNHDRTSSSTEEWDKVFSQTATDGVAYQNQYFAASNEKALTTAHKFTAGNLDYLLVAISWLATPEDIAWANAIVEAHPNHNVIITTHGFRNYLGRQTSISSYVEGYEQSGWEYYNWIDGINDIVLNNKNVVLTLNGHHPTSKIVSHEIVGVNGNKIVSLVIDPTYFDGYSTASPNFANGAGMIASLRFSNGGKKVNVSWYSSVLDEYYNSESAYSFELETVQRKSVNISVRSDGGSASYAYTNDEQKYLKITLSPQAGYYVSKFVYNGQNVTRDLKNNEFFVVNTLEKLDFIVEFTKYAYALNVENDNEKGGVVCSTGNASLPAGQQIDVMIAPKSGWEIATVKLNGVEIQVNTNGNYTFTKNASTDVLTVEYSKVEIESVVQEVEKQQNNTQEQEKTNVIGVVLLCFGVGAVVALAFGFTFITIKKKKYRKEIVE